MKILLIGAGEMGTALLRGLVQADGIKRSDLGVLSGHVASTKKVAENFGITAVSKLEEAKNYDAVICAVPAKFAPKTLNHLGKSIKENAVLVSVAYGIELPELADLTGRKDNLLYLIPNLPVQVNQGVLAINHFAEFDYNNSEVAKVLEKLGQVVEVPAGLMDVVSAGAGSAPAYVAMMIEGLADGMVLHGLNRELAYQVAEKMVQGTATTLLETKQLPAELKDGVASPGGSTIRGVASLEEDGLRSAMIKAITKTIN